MTIAAPSLFDKPTQPVFGVASAWTQGVLGGSVSTSLCVIAIAILGIFLLAGRLQVRRSIEVIFGCFLLLSAGLMASQLQRLAGSAGGSSEEIIISQARPAQPPPPARYDPYAGPSLPFP